MTPQYPFRIACTDDDPDAAHGACRLVVRIWPLGVGKEALGLDAGMGEVTPRPTLRTWFGRDPEERNMFFARLGSENTDQMRAGHGPRPFAVENGFEAARLPNIFPEPHTVALAISVSETGVHKRESAS